MEEIIHINIGAHKVGDHYIGTYTVRIWANLLASVMWIYKNLIPGNYLIQHGISMTIINNMAIVLEGFIADICCEHLRNKDELRYLLNDIDVMTWQKKRELYNKLFKKKLEEYYGFEGMSILIGFRNNLAHGRTYTEYTKREHDDQIPSPVEAENKSYQNLRDYLIQNGILQSKTNSSNVEVPWKFETANHFVGLAKHFMSTILRENEFDNKAGIENEFKLACNS